MKRQISPLLGTIVIIAMIVLHSCGRDELYQGDDINVTSSVDTLLFDTVFTEVGSITRRFKVYNDLDQAISVDVNLEGGANSFYRINADGIAGPEINNAVVQANDSMYVFVEVTIDPDMPLSISPFVIEDKVIVTGGDKEQIVHLEAFGQNANYIIGRDISNIMNICESTMSQVWDDPKPYVIYGILGVVGCDLEFAPGTKIYVHGGLVIEDSTSYNAGRIIAVDGGTIQSNGTAENPVIIQGDRLEEAFDDVSGQWFGIFLGANSVGNNFTHTTIKNGIYSILADSSSSVDISHTQMLNSASIGLFGNHAKINVDNSLIQSAGSFGVYWNYGGEYTMDYSTVVSYSNQSEALRMQNYLCTDPLCLGEIRTFPLDVEIRNSIIAGSSRDELLIDEFDDGSGALNTYKLNNTLVKVDELLDAEPNFFDNCADCINYDGSDPLFVDINEGNYELDSLSVAERKAVILPGIGDDLLGRPRSTMPDIGCFESQFKM